jgi:RNA polymerase sigma-54 factor
LIGLDETWSELYEEAPRRSRAALSEESDRKQEAMQNMASRPRSFHDDLADQLSFCDCEPIVREIAEYIVYNLDEKGLFQLDLQDVVRDFNARANLRQAEDALRLVQHLDPPGVGARDLRECLLLQLTPETPCHDVLQILISQHFDDLEHNRLPAIEKKTGIPLEKIKDALEHLRRLNLRPGAAFEIDNPHYVVPDLIVEQNDHGGYDVRLAEENSPQLAISRYYQKQLRNKETDQATREYIQKKIQSARWLIESIEQRRNTLLRVARAIIEHQKVMLEKGPEFIEPLKMQQIADRVGVHVTTVSRAVDDKWVQTPRGIFALKRFFGGGTTTADGDEIAWDTIKQKLLEIIAKEDKQSPMSDEEIVDEMAHQGLKVARRTVTKYRQTLLIPSSRQRKQF